MHRSTSFAFLFALAAACTSNDDASRPSETADASSDASVDASLDAAAQPTSTVIASFDPQKYELPEALSVRDDAAFVSFVGRGEIERVGLDGTRSLYAKLPGSAKSLTLGSAFGIPAIHRYGSPLHDEGRGEGDLLHEEDAVLGARDAGERAHRSAHRGRQRRSVR